MNKHSMLLCLLLSTLSYESFAEGLSLESPAFKKSSLIPIEFTCNGDDKSPPLVWHDAPPNTKSFTLVVEDPDAPSGTWTHWVLFNIPPTVNHLDAGAAVPDGAAMGKNSWHSLGYKGPCPPLGMTHGYYFKLYAVDRMINVENGAESSTVLDAITGHVLGSSEWIGLYQKQ